MIEDAIDDESAALVLLRDGPLAVPGGRASE